MAKMVAEFYGVDVCMIKRYVQKHGDELRFFLCMGDSLK